MGQKEPPRLGSTICYGQTWATKSHQDSAARFVTAKSWPEKATKPRQYDLLRPRVGQKEPPRLGSTICYGQTWARKSHQDSAARFVTAKSWPERATETRQYDLLRPNVGQKEPPRLGSTICYGQDLARKSHQDSAVRFVAAKSWPERATKTRQCYLLRPRVWPERATKTRQYDLLRPNVCQKKPPRLGNTICHGQELARKSHQDSTVRFVTAKSWPERATKTRQYDLLRPNMGQKEPPRLGSTICYGQELARKCHQDSAARFVTAKRGPEKATKTRQYDLLRPNVGQKEPLRLGSTICYGQDVGQKEPPRLGSTICYGQELARKSHQDSAVRFVTAKSWPERATKTRQYDLLRPNFQKEPPRLGSTICYGQKWARKSHQDSAVRFVTAKRGPERATKTRQYDLLRPRRWPEKPPRLGSTICYGQTWARKSHQDSAVRFVTAKSGPERATKTRQYDLLRPKVGQKEPPRLGSTMCYGQTWARKSHQDSAVRFVMAKSWPENATKTRQYDLLRPNVGQKEPPRLGSTICYGPELARKSHRDSAVRFVTAKRGPERATKTGSTICYSQELARKSHQDSAVRFVTAKRGPERATKTRQYDLLRPRVWPERATKTRQYDLLRPNVGQKEPPRLGSTICYGQDVGQKDATKTRQYDLLRPRRWPERATKTRQYDLLRPRNGQKEPPRLGSTICYGQDVGPERATKTRQYDFVTAKTWPERATKTRQYDLLRPRVGQKDATKTRQYDLLRPNVARKSHQDSAVRFVTAKRGPERATETRQYDLLRPRRWPERATKTRQYDLLRPSVARKSHQDSAVRFVTAKTLARKSHRDSAVRFVTAKSWPEKATKTRQYDLLRPRVGQKEPPRLGSTICYGQELARRSHQDSAVRFVKAKSCPRKSHQDSAVRFVTAKELASKEPPGLGSTICYGQELATERATKTRQYDLLRPRRVNRKKPPRIRQYDLLRPNVGQKEPPRLGSTICYGQDVCQNRATKTRQ